MQRITNGLVRKLSVLAWLTCPIQAVHAGPITPDILNDLVSGVYDESTHLMIFSTFGLSFDQLSISGTFADTGWTTTTTGVYGGLPVNISAIGAFDTVSNTGTVVAMGSVGSAAWVASGAWVFTSPDPLALHLLWTIQATVQTNPVSKPDVSVDKDYMFDAVPPRRLLYTDRGTQQMSKDGTPFGPALAETSAGSYDFDLGTSTHFTTGGFVAGTSENKIPPGTRTGTTTIIPEPSTLVLIGTGVICLGLRRLRKV